MSVISPQQSSADYLLQQWAIWSKSGGGIPKGLHAVSAHWQREIPTDYPEEPDHEQCGCDDEEMSIVDTVVAGLQRVNVKAYVVILDVYRNGRDYHKSAVDEAMRVFEKAYSERPVQKRRLYA